MAPLRVFVILSVFAWAVLYTQAAPTADAPARNLANDTDVNPTKRGRNGNREEVNTDERFYRSYPNGTIEFKTALSNGHIQYQRISNKVVDGKTIQVYEGYVSQRLNDGTYSTSYYIADENGYRRTPDKIESHPPVLPQAKASPSDSTRSISTEGDDQKSNSVYEPEHPYAEDETNEVIPHEEEPAIVYETHEATPATSTVEDKEPTEIPDQAVATETDTGSGLSEVPVVGKTLIQEDGGKSTSEDGAEASDLPTATAVALGADHGTHSSDLPTETGPTLEPISEDISKSTELSNETEASTEPATIAEDEHSHNKEHIEASTELPTDISNIIDNEARHLSDSDDDIQAYTVIPEAIPTEEQNEVSTEVPSTQLPEDDASTELPAWLKDDKSDQPIWLGIEKQLGTLPEDASSGETTAEYPVEGEHFAQTTELPLQTETDQSLTHDDESNILEEQPLEVNDAETALNQTKTAEHPHDDLLALENSEGSGSESTKVDEHEDKTEQPILGLDVQSGSVSSDEQAAQLAVVVDNVSASAQNENDTTEQPIADDSEEENNLTSDDNSANIKNEVKTTDEDSVSLTISEEGSADDKTEQPALSSEEDVKHESDEDVKPEAPVVIVSEGEVHHESVEEVKPEAPVGTSSEEEVQHESVGEVKREQPALTSSEETVHNESDEEVKPEAPVVTSSEEEVHNESVEEVKPEAPVVTSSEEEVHNESVEDSKPEPPVVTSSEEAVHNESDEDVKPEKPAVAEEEIEHESDEDLQPVAPVVVSSEVEVQHESTEEVKPEAPVTTSSEEEIEHDSEEEISPVNPILTSSEEVLHHAYDEEINPEHPALTSSEEEVRHETSDEVFASLSSEEHTYGQPALTIFDEE